EASLLLPKGSLLAKARQIAADVDNPFDDATREFIAASWWRSMISRLNIGMLALFPLLVVLAIAVPNVVGSSSFVFFLYITVGFGCILMAWPLLWSCLSWRSRRRCFEAVARLPRRDSKATEEGESPLHHLEAAVRWPLRAAPLNVAMVTLATSAAILF